MGGPLFGKQLIGKKSSSYDLAIDREIFAMGADIRKWIYFVNKGGRIDFALGVELTSL